MLSLFRRRRPRAVAPQLTPRSDAIAVARVELAELTPPTPVYLGRLGYLTLVLFENLSRAVLLAPTTSAKTALSAAVAEVLEAHEGVVTEMRGAGIDPVAAMEPFRAELDDFRRRIQGADWPESLVTCYLTGGFLTDFFTGLAAGLPSGLSSRVSLLLDIDKGQAVLVAQLRTAIEGSSRLASRLAMWGRRLVGDTMLVARSSLAIGGQLPGEERIEPVFTELISAHTRRMDVLGLTA
ncbi:ferritin-like fold-containing protein [Lysinimonas soli]|uniref:Ferritin-like fold-containing protein n=1 Tax=Lysinimonas soli TaxID=1074233 RepID=A0ABW0NL46_9MICO